MCVKKTLCFSEPFSEHSIVLWLQADQADSPLIMSWGLVVRLELSWQKPAANRSGRLRPAAKEELCRQSSLTLSGNSGDRERSSMAFSGSSGNPQENIGSWRVVAMTVRRTAATADMGNWSTGVGVRRVGRGASSDDRGESSLTSSGSLGSGDRAAMMAADLVTEAGAMWILPATEGWDKGRIN